MGWFYFFNFLIKGVLVKQKYAAGLYLYFPISDDLSIRF